MLARRVLLLAGAGLALVLAFAAPPAHTGKSVLGHFLCYKSKQTQGNVCVAASEVNPGAACQVDEDCGTSADLCRENKLPKGTRVTIADVNDGLGSQVDLRKGVALCNPANKNGEGFVNEVDHLRGFTIAIAKTSPAQPPLPALTGVQVSNQFGSIQLDQKKLDRLMLPAGKTVKAPSPQPEDQDLDHFRCSKVKGTKGQPRFEPVLGVTVVDQFGQSALYDLKKPSRLCTVVEKNLEGFIRPNDALLCYQAKRAKEQAKHVKVLGLYVVHQLARERLDTVKEEELCVPSELII